MADTRKTQQGPERIPGYGQPPKEGERSGQPGIPDAGNRWGAQTEGKPRQAGGQGSEGQNVRNTPDVSEQPLHTPKQSP